MSDDRERSEPDDRSAAQGEVEYSEDFAAMILAQEKYGFQEIDPDDLLALLERMLSDARNGE